MNVRVCPGCGQPVLPPTKAIIFDLLHRAGRLGVTLEEIRSRLLALGREPGNDITLRSHIYQLAEQIEASGYRIGRTQRRTPSRWVLLDRREAA